ncbi:PIG-L deacetylase family protein [Streptomyces gamaensis]|uniref:PIG-L deacetylase family protein n=1 Tax=Streptomyces gamaensis TaxID=1763542 RepID=A0ABW0YVK4_9ACTN
MTGAPVVISPHPDDAVWSLGGRLARWSAEGLRPTVVTVFAGTPGERRPAPAGGPEEWRDVADPAVRRAEDLAALAELGAARVALGFTDAALRSGSGGYRYTRPRALFGPPHPADRQVLADVRAALEPLCAAAASVHVPLAAGGHVDHRLVRAAVAALVPEGTVWYEDFPYRLRERDHAGLLPRFAALAPAHLERWLAAAGHYASQARAHFGGVGRLRAALLDRARAHGAAGAAPCGTDGPALADRHWVPDRPRTEGGGTTRRT